MQSSINLTLQVIRECFFSALLNYCIRHTDKQTMADGRHLEHRGEIFVTSVSVCVICECVYSILHTIVPYSISSEISGTALGFSAAVGLISLMFV